MCHLHECRGPIDKTGKYLDSREPMTHQWFDGRRGGPIAYAVLVQKCGDILKVIRKMLGFFDGPTSRR